MCAPVLWLWKLSFSNFSQNTVFYFLLMSSQKMWELPKCSIILSALCDYVCQWLGNESIYFRKDLFAKASCRIILECIVWRPSVAGKAMCPETRRLPAAVGQVLGAKSDLGNDTALPVLTYMSWKDTPHWQFIYQEVAPLSSIMSAIGAY